MPHHYSQLAQKVGHFFSMLSFIKKLQHDTHGWSTFAENEMPTEFKISKHLLSCVNKYIVGVVE